MKKLLFYDHGLFLSFARKLSKYFQVFYYTPALSQAFPNPNNAIIGDGYEEVTRVKDFWRTMPDMDIFLFADIYDGGLQEHLRSMGKLVFGAGRGEDFEILRWKMKDLMRQVKLPVGKCDRVIGMHALREYLKEHEDVYVKVSGYRGVAETFNSKSYDLIEPRLDEIENELGGLKYCLPFIIEHRIESVIEVGSDGYTIDGEFPKKTLFGVEIKDCGYIGSFLNTEDLPKQVNIVNDRLSKLFKEVQYRMFFSTEIRVAEDGTPYLIDMTCRFPSPPNELYQEMYGNLDEIIWEGAQGKMVSPKPIAKYGVEAIIYSSFAEDHWNTVYFPDEVSQWVKLHNNCKLNGVDHIIPTTIRMGEIGAVVGIGDTILEAIQHCRENASQISGFDVKVKTESLVEGLEEIKKAEDFGIKFTDKKLPTVEEILA